MVRTTTIKPRAMLAALAGGSVLAAGVTGIVVGSVGQASAAEASTAYGVSAGGTDGLRAQPYVSSAGAVASDSLGSVRSKTGVVKAKGLSVKAGAGTASATVADVTVGGKSIGPVSTTCTDGKASAGRTGTVKLSDTLTVTYGSVSGGKATGATITLTGADGGSETALVAVVSCGAKPTNPPTHDPGPGKPVPGQPGPGQPTGGQHAPGKPAAGGKPGTRHGGAPTLKPAPAPQPKPGHQPVTG
ncbi:hypothetical protein [Amycolatopsis rubida]|uniref:Uncharacterized protein n=1 Tax=Amycolatopsis rubida TaxID=112413 RepID=A0A1I5XEU5_9PSEU|nr:hypothetical protein [Amycolatopsis rubida]SFQ30481.1 hypothetical protein SAMN05421854_110187 [Amycolatopsis rubida]